MRRDASYADTGTDVNLAMKMRTIYRPYADDGQCSKTDELQEPNRD